MLFEFLLFVKPEMPKLPRTKQIAEAYRRGDRIPDIIAKYGISHGRVCSIAREAGLPSRHTLWTQEHQKHIAETRKNDIDKDIADLYPRLNRYALTLTGLNRTRAEDLVQSTVLRAMEYEAQFERGTNLFAWCCTIMRSVRIHESRKESREIAIDEASYEDYVGIEHSRGDGIGRKLAKIYTKPNQIESLMLQDVLKLAKYKRRRGQNPKIHEQVQAMIEAAVSGDDYRTVAKTLRTSEQAIKHRIMKGRLALEKLGV